MDLADFFTPEAGQRRRKWLDDQSAKVAETARYYLGPTGVPQRANVAANVVAALSPAADVADAYDASGDLMRSRTPLDAATAGAGLAAALGGMFIPGSASTARQGFEDLVDAGVDAHKSGTAFMFLGPRARTADHEALAKAKRLADQGEDADVIVRETGWFRGTDGQWRFEIDDSKSRLNLPPVQQYGDMPTPKPLAEALRHKQLYDAYPELGRIPVFHSDLGPGGVGELEGHMRDGATPVMMTISPRYAAQIDPHSTALHETQHAVQQIENFARGSWRGDLEPGTDSWRVYQEELAQLSHMPPDQAKRRAASAAYERSAGEVEARNAAGRHGMTDEMRRTFPAWKTQDTPNRHQIVQFDDNEEAVKSYLEKLIEETLR